MQTAKLERLDGRACVVTGGSAGIGFAIVQRLVREGAWVLFCGTNAERGLEAQRRLPEGRALFTQADVGVEADVDALIAAGAAKFGRLDILVNNAAKGVAGLIPELTTARWRRSNAVNVDSVFFASRAAIPLMQKSGGAIINIASISGLAGDGAYPSYCAQKAAVINLTRAMAVQHARDNVRINAVCPGYIDTPATAAFDKYPDIQRKWREMIPVRRFGHPEEVAGVVAFLASADSSYVHGSVIVVDGGMTASTGQPTQDPF